MYVEYITKSVLVNSFLGGAGGNPSFAKATERAGALLGVQISTIHTKKNPRTSLGLFFGGAGGNCTPVQ